jgi:hypothetical protein
MRPRQFKIERSSQKKFLHGIYHRKSPYDFSLLAAHAQELENFRPWRGGARIYRTGRWPAIEPTDRTIYATAKLPAPARASTTPRAKMTTGDVLLL